MATNVSSLRVRITGETGGLRTALEGSSKTVRRFAGDVQRTQAVTAAGFRSISGGSRQAQFVISQLGFGLEDFLTQVETMGVGGGLRAAGNNLSVVASTLNPMAGVVVGIGTALGAILIPKLVDAAGAAKDFVSELKQIDRIRLEGKIGELTTPDIPLLGAKDEDFVRAEKEFADQIAKQERNLEQARREFLGTIIDHLPTADRDAAMRAFEDAMTDGLLRTDIAGSAVRDTNPFADRIPGADVLTPEFRAELRGIVESAHLANEALRGLAADRPELERRAGISREVINPGIEHARKLFDDFIGQFTEGAEFRDETRAFVTEFLGDVSDREQRVAQANAALDKRLREIDKLFPGAANARRRETLANAAREIAQRDAKGKQQPFNQGLSGGFAFGSREAVSALNKAAFSREKTDDKIEKNTKEAAEILKGIDRKLGRPDRGPELVAGPSIP